jgi:hypothetical protein
MRECAILGVFLIFLLAAGCSETDTKEWLSVKCLERPDSGPCEQPVYGYYYDYASDQCRAFAYGGCKGHVPFQSREACVSLCESGQAETGGLAVLAE